MESNIKKECIYAYNWIHFAIQQRFAQHCKFDYTSIFKKWKKEVGEVYFILLDNGQQLVWDWGWPTTVKLLTKGFTFTSKSDYITALNFIGDFRQKCNRTLNEEKKMHF